MLSKLEKLVLENIDLSKRNQFKIKKINDYFPPNNDTPCGETSLDPYNVISHLHYIANALSDSNSILYQTNEALDRLV